MNRKYTGFLLLPLLMTLAGCSLWLPNRILDSSNLLPFEHLSDGRTSIQEYQAGVALFDYNGDGTLDVYLTNGEGSANALLKNVRGHGLVDVAARAGVDQGNALGAASADIDNDGDEDLLVTSVGLNRLYLNHGNGTFEDIAPAAGVSAPDIAAYSVAFCDLDLNGYVDIYLGSLQFYGNGRNLLYLNNGDLTFREVGQQLHVDNHRPISRSAQTSSWDVACFDYDLDGDQDLLAAVDFSVLALFKNELKETGQLGFSNVSLASGLDQIGNWMGLAIGDFNGDGYPDFFATNWGTSPLYRSDPPIDTLDHALFINNGDGTFRETGLAAGVGRWELGWGACALDWNNDGYTDLYYAGNFMSAGPNPGHLFINDGQGHFIESSATYGLINQLEDGRFQHAHGVACGDLDEDGFYDIVVANAVRFEPAARVVEPGKPMYFRNHPNGNHWLKVKTVGTRSNRDGIGAKVYVTTGSQTQLQEVRSGSGHLSQSSKILGFGLGEATVVDRIEVHWPSGLQEVLKNISVDQKLIITEGQSS